MKVLRGGVAAEFEAPMFLDFSNRILVISWLRLILYGTGYVGLILLQLLQADFLCSEVWQPVHILMFVAFCAHFCFLESIESEKWQRKALELILALDALILAGFLWVLGSEHSIFLFLLLIIVSVGGFSLGWSYGLKLALWGAGLFSLVHSLNLYFHPETMRALWLVNNISVILAASLSGILGSQIQNVTEDIESKKEDIQALTDFNELIADNIPSALLVVNSNFQIQHANRGAARIFSDLALNGKSLNEISLDLQVALQKFVINDKSVKVERLEMPYLNFRNEKLILEVIFSFVRRRGEVQPQYICLVQNLTEIKNLEYALRQKEKLAAVGQLAAGIAHEIRNPLASISGSVQLLQGHLQAQTPEDKKLLAIIIREIDRLNHLISEFLDFVRPEVRLEDPIQINSLVKEVLDMVKVNNNLSKKVEQMTELRSQNLILGHYDKLKQALLNIVINAYQAMGDTLRPQIYVQTQDLDGKVILIVRDNGMGMTEDNKKRIFEPFHTTKPQGTGLGLAITHKILETHNAEVSVESEVGEGTKFSIVFPAAISPDSNKRILKKQA